MLMARGWCKRHCFPHITVICNLQIIYCRHLPSPVVEHCCNPNCPTAKWSLFPYGLHRARGSPNLAPSGGTVKQLVVTGTSAFVAMLTLQDTHRSWIIYLYMSVSLQAIVNCWLPHHSQTDAPYGRMAIHVAWLFEVTITCFYSSLTLRLQNPSPSKGSCLMATDFGIDSAQEN